MTKIDREDVQDRVTVMDDEKKRVLDLYDMRLAPPEGVGIFDSPTRCYTVNLQWAKIIMGMVSWLAEVAPWRDAEHEGYPAILEIQRFLEGGNCDSDCTIEELLADEDFFNNEYVPQTFGDWYTETNAHNDDLNAVYDGTPQSIGSSIPIGAPNTSEKNALCAAINRFVDLYASGKLCILQSHNFLQIAWDELAQAANAVYNTFANLMAFVWTPNLYSCFVSDDEAITALQDTAAIADLGCFLYDELSTVVISQANFDDAILAAATSLTGNAQKIACLMQNDNNLSVYLNFLESYNIALLQQTSGNYPTCPCEDLFWCRKSTAFSSDGWTIPLHKTGGLPMGQFASCGAQSTESEDVPGQDHETIKIDRVFASAVNITSVEVELEVSELGTTAEAFLWINLGGTTVLNVPGSVMHFLGTRTYIWSGSVTVNNMYVRAETAVQPAPPVPGKCCIKSVIVRGTGANPFAGGDNC